jgi:solute carrier family 25 S-adenosylmethionine transporter 26
LKTRFQSPEYKKVYFDASRNTWKRKLLFRGLYQGVGSVILITIPSCKPLLTILINTSHSDIVLAGSFFTTYEAAKSLLSKANPHYNGSPLIPQPFLHSAASAAAELVSCFILTPAEVLKQNAQMMRRPAESSASRSSTLLQPSITIQTLKRFRRPSQLFRGYTALAARNLPFTAMQFPMFEHIKDSIKQHRKEKGIATGGLFETALLTAASAGIAGSIAATITTPVDVVKTRIMLSATGESSQPRVEEETGKTKAKSQYFGELDRAKGAKKKSGLTIAREIMGESGIKGLFRGGSLRVAWTALGSGMYLGVYESGRVWLGNKHGVDDVGSP